MTFRGFSIPDGAYLPPELIYLLPNMSLGQLKCLIVILYHNLQIGSSEPLSLNDIEKLSGMARQTVITALGDMLRDGWIERQAVGNSYTYSPVVQFLDRSVQKLDSSVQNLDRLVNRESDRELINSLPDSLNLINLTSDEDGLKIRLVSQLRQAGVYLKTAQDIVDKHDEATIEEHLKYYQYALSRNLAHGPGWLVMSLKEGWGAPLGYEEPMTEERQRSRYAEWNREV